MVIVGYSDGIPRNASNAVGVSFNGMKAPLVGRVSMDQISVNLGINTIAKAGDYVTVLVAKRMGDIQLMIGQAHVIQLIMNW